MSPEDEEYYKRFDPEVNPLWRADALWDNLVHSSRMGFLELHMGEMNLPLMVMMGHMKMPESIEELSKAIGESPKSTARLLANYAEHNGWITMKMRNGIVEGAGFNAEDFYSEEHFDGRAEEVADRNEGQVVNITNVGDRVFVTVRHHYYDDFDNPILDDRAMRPYEIVYEGSMEDLMLNNYTNSRGQEITFEALASGDIEMDRFTLREISESLTPEQKKDVEHWINLYGVDGALNQIEMMGWDVKPKPKEVEVVVEYTSDEDIHTIYDLLTNANLKVVSVAPVLNPEDFYAEEFGATKGIDTYAQPFEEMKIGSTTKKVATLIAAMIGGGAIYSHFTKRSE